MTAVLAIDGPSGAGKGTVARAVARALKWSYVDTGAMYRAVAWNVIRRGLPIDDEEQVAALADAAVFELDFGRVCIDGEDVTRLIRTPEMDVAAATVARMPHVRRVLVARQRDYAVAGPVVMEGRDIGTVVFPDAMVKLVSRCVTRGTCEPPSERSGPWIVEGQRDRSRRICTRDTRSPRSHTAGVSADPSERRDSDRDHWGTGR